MHCHFCIPFPPSNFKASSVNFHESLYISILFGQWNCFPLNEIIYNCGDCAIKGLFRRTADIFYDLEAAKEKLSREVLEKRVPGVWKYIELLPILDESNVVTMGEGGTPLQRCKRYSESLGMSSLYLKDEMVNPTWSFKDRVFSVNISKAVEYYES